MRPSPPQNTFRNIFRKLIIFGFVALISILVGYLIIIKWWFPGFSQSVSGMNDWNLLEGFASVISLSLLGGGLIFAITEYINREDAKQAEKLAEEREKAKLSFEIYKAIYDKLTDPKQEAARRWLLSNITIKKDNEDLETWYEQTHTKIMSGETENIIGLPEGQNAIKMTLNCLDYIGFIASHYWEVEKDTLDWISAPVAKVWRRIGPYVLHVRTLRDTTDYYLSAEYIGDLCLKWRQEKGLPDEKFVARTP
jgi:hypothetical protein